ncbi:MAG: hypothetical protein J07HQW2_00442 [Haloquadratum walsbyi J07HQW2]|jgi:hypothetical protein|uniref:Uncharacterized protein n=1 Tax=Haloquadratum walsbyi J07HQW2 TaxID=1238425 RepID=U1NBJ4_9EURY|nr:MAG: hypothetical protein J07HQW2_00442 [Haloquadratum walsbyi J07HQW2]
MDDPVTPRDRVWRNVVNAPEVEFTASDMKRKLDQDKYDEPPTEGVIEDVLEGMAELEIISQETESRYYKKQTDFTALSNTE